MSGAALLKVTKDDTPTDKYRFQGFMVSFPGFRDGFKKGCQKFIGLDDLLHAYF